ncbi:MAG: diadenylate cyclase CdaA [Bdellovibrionales bacterium]
MTAEGLTFFISNLEIKDFIDLFLLWVIFYQIFKFSEKSGIHQVLLGLGVVAMAFFVSAQLELIAVHTLLQNVFANLFLVLALIFQNEIRRGLSQLGSQSLFKDIESVEAANISEEMAKAILQLSKKGIGALIVFEKKIDLSAFIESGVDVSSSIKAEMIEAIFHPSSKIHDGAIIVKNGKIQSAGAFLPLSTNPALDRNLGTRHRSALGITEVTDSKVIVVSEESKNIGFVEDGRLHFIEDPGQLSIEIRNFLSLKRQGLKR